MQEYLWIGYVMFGAVVAAFIGYSIGTKGFKGSQFGYRIKATAPKVIEYHRGSAKHSLQIHDLDHPDYHGLEIGRWMGPLGETNFIVIPTDQLVELAHMIDQFVVRDSVTLDV